MRVGDGRGRRKACAIGSEIRIPKWARNTWIVLHELAHVVAGREFKGERASHGWEFCETYLKLVLYVIGREAHDALKESMRGHRVRFREPRQRAPLSPERRAQLVAQLADAREQRM